MSEENPLYFLNRNQWREWLNKNHKSKDVVWLGYFKKHTNKPSIQYNDAVEEALCFGWIDGKIRRIDDERFIQRYTPRRPNSKWSMTNCKRVNKMIKAKKMTEAGLLEVQTAKNDGRWDQAYTSKKPIEIPPDLIRALKKEKQALQNFNNFPKSTKLTYTAYILDAKREETRKRRIMMVVERSRKNQKPGMM